MGKSATYDPTAIGLVKAGLITYKQLNEVHRLLKSAEAGGSLEDLLVQKGYLTKTQLRNRKRRQSRTRPGAPRLADALNLVKVGLVTFRQLNECQRLARESNGEKTTIEVLKEKSYITDEQLATLPKNSSSNAKSKRFSSSWDLFRAGVVNLRALNECHKYIKKAPQKSLKEALLERGYVSEDDIEKVQQGLPDDSKKTSSPFMERYKDELASIPEELREQLRAEHEAVLEDEIDDEDMAPPPPKAQGKIAATLEESYEEEDDGADHDFQDAKTFMDFGDGADADDDEDDWGPDGGADDFQGAKTFMDFGDDGDSSAD
ncbi:MAG: hypothetical protein P1V97_12505, partial [Planctomycetota bacterium]|nr:hypothetical protein [Planctomycetota bacterium]